MAFELFAAVRGRIATEKPLLSIQSAGVLLINGALYRLLGSPTRSHIFYDRDRRYLGLRAASGEDLRAYKVSAAETTRRRSVFVKAFLDHYDLDAAAVAGAYPVHQEGDITYIDLNEHPDRRRIVPHTKRKRA